MATLSTTYKVGNSYIYEPNAGYSEEEDSLANEQSGRTDDGVMHITWVRTSIRKWSFTYQGLTATELAYMRGLLQGKKFNFSGYFHGAAVTNVPCYCSNNSVTVYMQRVSGNKIYTDVSFNIIEM